MEPGIPIKHVNVIGVQFRRAGRIYDFSTNNESLIVGDDVVVETDRGPSLAKVAYVRYVDAAKYAEVQLKPILRKASTKDLDEKGKLTPEKAMSFAREKITKLQLTMRVLKTDVQFGGNKVIIYFSAPGRVDFRELVKELASGLKARVELRQVGARDEAKLVGGVGICGREHCCSCCLREFVPVSIRMAKNQNLALNPSKVSGGCGRLLCCLTYENDFYANMRTKMPPKGSRVKTKDGRTGEVIGFDILNQAIQVSFGELNQAPVPIDDIEVISQGTRSTDSSDTSEWEGELDEALLSEDESRTNLDQDLAPQARPSPDRNRNFDRGRPPHSHGSSHGHDRDRDRGRDQGGPHNKKRR